MVGVFFARRRYDEVQDMKQILIVHKNDPLVDERFWVSLQN